MSYLLSVLLVFLLPTQLGQHFWPSYAFTNGLPVDYLSPTLFLTDVLLIGLFLKNITQLLKLNKKYLVVITLGIAINTLFAVNKIETLIFWGRLILLGNWVLVLNSFSPKQFQTLLKVLGSSLVYVFVLAVLQFINQSSLQGIWYWLGERKLDVGSLQTAAIKINGQLIFRPYSTFSHPNSMAGYVLLVLVLVSSPVVYVTGIATLILSLSRNAFGAVAFLIAAPRISRKLARTLVYLFVVSSALVLYFRPVNFGQSIDRRVGLQHQATILLQNHPIFGVGWNNFISEAAKLPLSEQLGSWLQPVHNIFWLITTETGVVGMIVVIFLIYKLEQILVKQDLKLELPLWIILITGSWDHYWLTLPQNRLLVAFYLGLIFARLTWEQPPVGGKVLPHGTRSSQIRDSQGTRG